MLLAISKVWESFFTEIDVYFRSGAWGLLFWSGAWELILLKELKFIMKIFGIFRKNSWLQDNKLLWSKF